MTLGVFLLLSPVEARGSASGFASVKIRLPINNDHQVALFGLGGISKIVQEETDEENGERILWRGNFGAKLGVLGLSHTYLLNEKTY